MGPGKRKTLKHSELPKMETALYRWFLSQRMKHRPVSGEMLKEKAKQLHLEIKENGSAFNASEGWLHRFKTRFGVRFLKIAGEKLSSRPELVSPFKKKLNEKIEEMKLLNSQLYNADETGLYWKLLPDKTHVSSSDRTAPGRKTEKQRLTFLACANADGTHKVKPLIIGRAKNPRSFKNFSCPANYRNSKSSWMTTSIFKDWFHNCFVPEVRDFMKRHSMPIKAILLLDNAPSHPPEHELKSKDGKIIAMFMPPNVTPLIQPMDQNVLRLTKLYYRNSLLASVVAKDSDVSETLKALTMKDAVLNLMQAWSRVQPETIRKCWKPILQTSEESLDLDEDNIPLSILRDRWRETDDNITPVNEAIQLLRTIDPEVIYSTTDINNWNDGKMEWEDKEETTGCISDDTEIIEEQRAIISPIEAIQIFNRAIEWAEDNNENWSDIMVLRKMQEKAVVKNLEKRQTQSKLTRYFTV